MLASWGIFPQGLLIQGVHIGLLQLLLGLGRLAVGLQLVAAVAFPCKPNAGLGSLLGLVGALHAHIVCSVSRISLWSFPRAALAGVSRTAWDNLEGGFFLSSSTSLVVTLPVSGSTVFCRDLLFGDFGLRLVCFGGGLVRLTDGLLQSRVSPFLVRKAQARFLIQTIPPT